MAMPNSYLILHKETLKQHFEIKHLIEIINLRSNQKWQCRTELVKKPPNRKLRNASPFFRTAHSTTIQCKNEHMLEDFYKIFISLSKADRCTCLQSTASDVLWSSIVKFWMALWMEGRVIYKAFTTPASLAYVDVGRFGKKFASIEIKQCANIFRLSTTCCFSRFHRVNTQLNLVNKIALA